MDPYSLNESWTPRWENLVGYWKLDDGEFAILDSKGIKHGRAFNTTKVHRKDGMNNCLQFDGTSSYIQLPLATTKVINITMSCWFQSDQHLKSGQTIFYNGSDQNRNGYGIALNNEGDTNGHLRVLYGAIIWFDTNVFITDNLWHHAVLVIRANGRPELYLDGQKVFVGLVVRCPNSPGLNAFTEIGRNDYPAARYFCGCLRDAAFWLTDLSPDEVNLVYKTQAPRYRDNHWIMGDKPLGEPVRYEIGEAWTPKTESVVPWTVSSTLKENAIHGTPYFVSEQRIVPAKNFPAVSILTYDGKKSFVQLPLLLKNNCDISMAAWFRTSSYRKRGQLIVYNGSDFNRDGYGISINNEGDTSGIVRVLYGGIVWFDTKTFVKDTKWHHVVLSILKDGTPELYLDSKLTFVGPARYPNRPTKWTEIGRNNYCTYRHFYGAIDNVGFWNCTLDKDDVLKIFLQQRALYVHLNKVAIDFSPEILQRDIFELKRKTQGCSDHPMAPVYVEPYRVTCSICTNFLEGEEFCYECHDCSRKECRYCHLLAGQTPLTQPWVPRPDLRQKTLTLLIASLKSKNVMRLLTKDIIRLLGQTIPHCVVRVGLLNNSLTRGTHNSLIWHSFAKVHFESDFVLMLGQLFNGSHYSEVFVVRSTNPGGASLRNRLGHMYGRPTAKRTLLLEPGAFNCLGAVLIEEEILEITTTYQQETECFLEGNTISGYLL
jgi:hypothetical protein